MKKLTAGIFATIMGLTAVNAYAAGEKIATTNYVKGAMTAAETAAVAAVEAKGYATTTQAQGYANAALADAQTYAEGQASAAQTAAKNYTDGVVGTVPAGSENVVAYVDKKTEGIATDGQISALDTRVTTAEGQIKTLQDAAATYATTYETKENVSAIDTRLTTAEGEIDQLQTMPAIVDAIDSRVADLETADTTFLTKDAASATYETIANVELVEGRVAALETAGYAKTSEITGTATVTNAVLTGVKLKDGVLSATGSMEIDDDYTDDNQPAV